MSISEWARPRLPKQARIPVAIGLLLPAFLFALWRTFLAQPFIPSDEQLNIATFVVAHDEPSRLAGDFAYGDEDPSRFYTPIQIALFRALMNATGSVSAAVASQSIPITVLTVVVAGGSLYLLTRRVLPAVIVGAASLNYRAVPSGTEIWGIGPAWTLIPRAWAAPLTFLAVALWLRALETRRLLLYLACGIVCGLTLNVHPPTGLPLSGAIITATIAVARGDRRSWTGAFGLAASCAVSCVPSLATYASGSSLAASVDFDAFLAAARLRVAATLVPEVFKTLGLSLVPDRDGFLVNLALTTAVTLGYIAGRPGGIRQRRLALLAATLVAVSVALPVIAQVALLQLRLNPMSTVDLFRGIRLLIPIGLTAGGLMASRLLDCADNRRWAGAGVAALLMADSAGLAWLTSPAGLAAVAVMAVSLWFVTSTRRRLVTVSVPLVVGSILVIEPILGVVASPRSGGLCCEIPARPPVELAADELIAWARTLPAGTTLETSALDDSVALRLRLESRARVSFIAKDGNVLLYADPVRAIAWSMRAVWARDAIARQDVERLRSAALADDATFIAVDKQVWPEVASGPHIVVSWEGVSRPSARDWIAVWPTGAPDNESTRLSTKYTGGTAAGEVAFAIPRAIGSYEVRLFSNDTWNRLASSGPVLVSGTGVSALPQNETGVGSVHIRVSAVSYINPVFENMRFTVFSAR